MEDRKFIQLDGLRFFAVLLVLFAHWLWFGHDFFGKIDSGSRGVDLFFVISGFLITLGLIRSREKTQTKGQALFRFYVRRFLRIFPAYYLFLLLVWLFNHTKVADSIWWYLFYAGNFYSIKKQAFGGVGHLWSLSVEEQFYFVWPFLILVAPVRRLPWVIGFAFVVSIAAKVYWWQTASTFWAPYMNPLGCLDVLSLGALLAYAYYFHTDRIRTILCKPWIAVFVLLQLAVFFAMKYFPGGDWIYNYFIRTSWGIFCTWLVGNAVFGFDGILKSILEWKPLAYIGQISYGVYLYQVFVPGMLMGIKYPASDSLRFILYFVGTIAIASASWYLFEKPILKLKERYK